MEENNSNRSSSVNYLFLIWLVMFVAKITGHIDWDWWIVFLPLSPLILVLGIVCAVICFGVAFCAIGLVIALIYFIYQSIKDNI